MKYLPYIIALAAVLILYFIFDMLIAFRKKSKKNIQQQKGKFYTAQNNFETLYEDSQDRGTLSMWLSDDTILYGRPDLVLKDKVTGEVIVVDYKSGVKKTVMPIEHQVQLASYFLLVENEFNLRPTKGIIRYLEDNSEDVIENDSFRTSEVSKEAMELAKAKKEIGENEEFSVHISHSDATKCAFCLYKKICPEKI